MAAPVPTPKELAALVTPLTGPLFVGLILNWGLLGTVTLQTYIYYGAGFKDRIWVKSLVGFLWILDCMHTVFATQCMWAILVEGWGDMSVLAFPPWTSITFPLMDGVIGGLVQIFFAWRIWNLETAKPARIAAIIIVLLAIMQGLSASVAAIRTNYIPKTQLGLLFQGYAVWLAGAFVADLMIVVCMLTILQKAKAKTTFAKTINLVDKLMIQTVHSGLITAILALAELILFLHLGDGNFIHVAISLILGKLYTNVLLANLNNRNIHGATEGSFNASTHGATSVQMISLRGQNAPGVHYTREVSAVDPRDVLDIESGKSSTGKSSLPFSDGVAVDPYRR